MKKISIFGTAVFFFFIANPLSAKRHEAQKYIFQNAHGDKIIITSMGATINGQFQLAKSCSHAGFNCVKYGETFAIVTPLSCDSIDDYKWSVDGVNSFIIALSPHDPDDVLVSTNYGGLVSFGYRGKGGVSYLFYDPAIRIGVRSDWQEIDHVDLDKVRYKKIHGGTLFPCKAKPG